MDKVPHVSVILPAYNERGNILPLTHAIHEALGPISHEVIIVDDNSPDGTYEEVVAAKLPYVRVFLRQQDRGLAKSIRHGLEQAQGDKLIVMDSDFNHPPQDLPFIVAALDHYEAALGTRFVYGGNMTSLLRYHLSWLFNIFVRFTLGGAITDNLSGFFGIRRKALNGLAYDEIFYGYGEYYIRLLYELQQRQLNIVQFPVAYGRRLQGQGNTNFLPTFIKYTSATMSFAWAKRFQGKKT